MSKGDSMPMLPWFHRDFLAATQGWTLAETGAYFLLLGAQWEMGPLPLDKTSLAAISRTSPREFTKLWSKVSRKFVTTADGLLNRRLEEHRRDAALRRDAHRQGARKTNAKRWGGSSLSDTLSESLSDTLTESLSVSPPSPSPSPSARRGEARACARPATATRLPDGWELTEERRQIAMQERVDPERTFAKFCDYWRAASGAKARKLDWEATWRNWCRTEADRSPGLHSIGKARGPSPEAMEREAMRKLVARRSEIGLAHFREPRPDETAEQYRLAQDAEFKRLERERVERARPVANLVTQLAATKKVPR
ncbi:MAG TPA: DUF1376 domain-containing protein [Steroidobacteraceae bacterium]|nr:DUF1376 domain-containing protein [Steroidobacteraceae bacterium]